MVKLLTNKIIFNLKQLLLKFISLTKNHIAIINNLCIHGMKTSICNIACGSNYFCELFIAEMKSKLTSGMNKKIL